MLIHAVILILWLRCGVSLLFLESNPSCAALSFLCVKNNTLHIPYYMQRCIPDETAPFIYDVLDDTEIELSPSSHLSIQYMHNTFHLGRKTCPHVLLLHCSSSILQPSHSSFLLPLHSSPLMLSLLSSSHVHHVVIIHRRCVFFPPPTTTRFIASPFTLLPHGSSLPFSSSSLFASSSGVPSSASLPSLLPRVGTTALTRGTLPAPFQATRGSCKAVYAAHGSVRPHSPAST